MRRLNAIVLALSMVFLTSQALSWADCCCGTFCQHKNACTGCGPEDACPGGDGRARTASCCDEEESSSEKTCSHLEPSSEIDTCAADGVPAPAAAVELAVPPDLSMPTEPTAPRVPAFDTGPPRAGPPGALRPQLLI